MPLSNKAQVQQGEKGKGGGGGIRKGKRRRGGEEERARG
jgi:hypothetical protein